MALAEPQNSTYINCSLRCSDSFNTHWQNARLQVNQSIHPQYHLRIMFLHINHITSLQGLYLVKFSHQLLIITLKSYTLLYLQVCTVTTSQVNNHQCFGNRTILITKHLINCTSLVLMLCFCDELIIKILTFKTV